MGTVQEALVETMVLVSAADGRMTDSELRAMRDVVIGLPVFVDFDLAAMPSIANRMVSVLENEDGIEEALDHLQQTIPPRWRETAYALACDVVAADGEASQEELRILEMLRHQIGVDRLTAAAIERGARARYTRP
jgi:tellurite resistance protein